MASVTRNPDLRSIQEEIARGLGLDQLRNDVTVRGAAHAIKAKLMKMKKVLIILDDIWKPVISLDELGLLLDNEQNTSEAGLLEKEHTRCKILLTSRDQNVLLVDMDAQECFPVSQLNYEEGLDLFNKINGDGIQSHKLQSTAAGIVKACGGLPLAVTTIAKALRNKSPHHWKDALAKLQRPSPENFSGISANIYSAIEVSYFHLESVELKKFLLLCSLMNGNMSYLMRYGMGLGLFHGINTLEKAQDRVSTLIDRLKDSSLVLDRQGNMWFKMHDVVCAVAKSIASRDHHLLSLEDEDIPKDWLVGEAFKKCSWIDLWYPDTSSLPDCIECPQLTFFRLSTKDHSLAIPENFFKGMPRLRVLDLTGMHFSSLPSSIGGLTNLVSLCLDQSVLGDMAILGELKNLEILALWGSKFEELPAEIGQLTQLKLLDLSNCSKLKLIPPHVLAGMYKLEELYLLNSFDQWEVEENENQRNASLAELNHLKKLTALELRIGKVQMIPKHIFSEKLERYKILIGDAWNYNWNRSLTSSRKLKLQLKASLSFDNSVKRLLKTTEELHLEELKGVKNVVDNLNTEGFPDLKYLYVGDAAEVQHVINSDEEVLVNAFPNLEILFLRNLINLEKTFQGWFKETAFNKLRMITVECCDQVKNLFSSTIARQLLQLQEISVRECNNMEEIVDDEVQGSRNDIVEEAQPKFGEVLRALRLQRLPKLSSFNRSCKSISLFNEQVVFPMLEELELTDIKIGEIWNTTLATPDYIQKLTKLSIVLCSNLKYLFSSSVVDGLVNLLHLEIRDCKSLREIIAMESGPEMGNCHVKFLSLKQLSIIDCPELVGFMVKSKSTNEADNVQPFFNEQVAFPSLESLILYHLKNLQMIWHSQLSPDSFCKLKELDVRGCENLMTIFTKDMLGSFFKSIEKLTIGNCASVEEVFKVGEINLKESVQTQLRNLWIYNLPSLKHVWNEDPEGILTFHNIESVIVSDCPNIKNLFPVTVTEGLKQLQKLQIERCGVEEIVAMGREGTEAVVKFVFPHLSNLKLMQLRRLRYFYPGKHIKLWPGLKKLNVFDCGRADQVEIRSGQDQPNFPIRQPFLCMEEIIPQLERLSLSQDDIAMINEFPFKQDFFFNIKALQIDSGGELPIGFLRRFYNLEKFALRNCSLKELFPSHGVVEEEQQKHSETQLPSIKTLKLQSIANLRHVWSGELSRLLQNLNKLEVFGCLDLISLSTSTTSFNNLTTLEVSHCLKMETLVSAATVQCLVHVKSITVRHCLKLTEIVGSQGDLTQDPIIFSNLRYLKLNHLIRLASFSSGNCTFDFPNLEQLIVEKCPKLEIFTKTVPKTPRLLQVQGGKLWKLEVDLNTTIQRMYTEKVGYVRLIALSLSEFPELMQNWHSKILDLRWLQFMDICNCHSLRYLLSPSMVRSLVILREIKVENCTIMEAVIMEEGAENAMMEEGAEKKIIIPYLFKISLDSCSDLTSFYLGSCTLQCPGLKTIVATNCGKLVTFTSLFSAEQEKEDSQALFSNKVAFPNLEWLTMTHLKNLELIWHSKLYADSFSGLKSLAIRNCEKLSIVFPSGDIQGRIWKSLEKLTLYRCGLIKEIFEIGEFNVKQTHAVMDTKLRELNINDLPRLKHVWNKDPQGILTFHNLESVDVRYCGSLKILFPASVGKSLLQLQKLHLYWCGVEEIVAMGGEQGAEAVVNFEFHRVSSLKLEVLPRLRCFYPGKHTTVWPRLKEFYFSHFNQVKRIDGCGQLDFPVCLPLFSIKKVIHQLEELSLTRHDVAMASEHQFKQDLFFNIKVLQIQNYLDDELDALPIKFLQSFCHLEKLVVTFCNFKELFPLKGEVGEQEKHIEIETLSRVKTLNLSRLPCLKHIWSHDSSSVLQNLESLEVARCESLISLSMSAASLRNLITLAISGCRAMINLVSISIAQSLVQLKRMTVSWCDMLTEIVGNEEDGTPDLITFTFTKLRFLTLRHLPRLESFCAGNFTFEFPSLEKVIVNQCPKLKIFSEGNLKTPLLQGVELIEGENKWHWAGDLNTTIKRMHIEKVGYTGLQFLTLSNFPELLEIWHVRNPQNILDFRQVTNLKICDCNNFRYLLTAPMALGLVQLLRLMVKNCRTMEQVIMGEGAENQMEFPHLWLINLESCSDLTSFYVGSHSLELPGLTNFIVKDCPKMVTFAASTSSEDHDKEESQYLFHSKVETPNLEFLSLSSNNIHRILVNSIPELSSYVKNLQKLCVEGCGNLKYLLTCSMVKSFEQLNWLEIRDCKMMEEVILAEESVYDERMCKIFFPNLEFLLLQDLPKLTRFCSGSYLELPCLWKLKISKCPMLKTFISSFTRGDMTANSESAKNTCALRLFDAKVAFPKLERLVIEYVESLNKIWNDQLTADSFSQLTLMSVVSCEKVLNIFPFSMLERLKKLDKLQIRNCDSLEEIFESQKLGVRQLQAQKATPLPLAETVIKFAFPKLTHLDLYGLPKLKGFFLQMHITEWPSLKKLWIYGCDQVQVFASELSSFQRIRDDNQLEIQIKHPLFWLSKATFPCLEELILEKNNFLKEIWNGQHPGDYLAKLKVLKLICLREQLALPSFFFQSLPNLERLVVSEASFNEIFHCENLGSEERPVDTPTQLSELKLSKLNELRHLWKKESNLPPIFCNLRTLEVLECSKLMILVPSIVSFENLQSLEVSKSHGLINLMRYSTAKSLAHLTRMSITDCDLIEEIVACLEDDVKDGIVFGKLKYLHLCGLPRLSSFCSVKCKFEFPFLEEVMLMDCPSMQIFCMDEITTPKLQKVKMTVNEDEGFWDGTLNSTIQLQFMQKSGGDFEN